MTETQAQQPVRLVVFADFVCPYSYLAVDQIDRLAREYDLQPLWRPHWLHPETPPAGTPRESTPEALAKRERLAAWIKEMAPDQYPRIRFPEKRHYSFFAFEALELAYDCGVDFAFKTALYELMWTQGRDIGELDTLVEAGAVVGIDPAEMRSALHGHVYAERALEALKGAHQIGIAATPTIFIGRTRINGWHYYEVLQSVLEQQGAKARELAH